jgi:hypothetical protein
VRKVWLVFAVLHLRLEKGPPRFACHVLFGVWSGNMFPASAPGVHVSAPALSIIHPSSAVNINNKHNPTL